MLRGGLREASSGGSSWGRDDGIGHHPHLACVLEALRGHPLPLIVKGLLAALGNLTA